MTPWLQDQDLTVWCGDALETLRGMADGSVDCVVTSPPYWGLRDYGTGEWDGGDAGCDHLAPLGGGTDATGLMQDGRSEEARQGNAERVVADRQQQYRDVCGKCGARRVDRQLGLEPTPDQYVARMVEVFREVRRVLAAYGTCWVNLGDSYAAQGGSKEAGVYEGKRVAAADWQPSRSAPIGLKPKDLVGVPWRVAFALQADGWYLRSDIIWSKPNPMPESVTDRPTKAHEYVFLLTRGPRYWFDQEAVREPWTTTHAPGSKVNETQHYGAGNGGNSGLTAHLADVKARLRSRVQYETLDDSEGEAPRGPDGRRVTTVQGGGGSIQHRDGERWPNGGRNVRSVWEIATQPYPEAHFATFPEELARRCIVAGCPEWVCGVCGKPRERIVDLKASSEGRDNWAGQQASKNGASRKGGFYDREASTLGWSDCDHNAYRPGVVLDPFGGSGTVAAVARKHGRRAVLIELNEQYCQLIARRTQQQSLFA